MCVCMITTFIVVWISLVRLPTLLLVSRTRKHLFPCPCLRLTTSSQEMGSFFPSRASPLILHTQTESSAHSRALSLSATASIYSMPSTSIGPVSSLSGHANAYRWRIPPKDLRQKAISPQGSWSDTCCELMSHHGRLFFVRISFPTPTYGKGNMCCSNSFTTHIKGLG